jgi:lipopolysaccharide exporter
MTDKKPKGLAEATLAALQWNYAGALTRTACQFAVVVVLARILGPEPFGLVAAAWLVIGLGNLVADFGLGAALVQRRSVSEEEIRYVFTVQVLLGVALTVAVASSAGLVARIFGQADLIPVVRALSMMFLIQAFGQTAFSLMKRRLAFKGLQLAQVLSYILAYIMLGIPLALLDFGVWSLVIAQLCQGTLYTAIAYLQVRHPVRPLLDSSGADLFDFGFKVVGTNLLNWSIISLDTLFVGRFFGVVELGLYNRAYTLLIAPMNNIVVVLQGVLFSASSRSQDEDSALKRGYLAAVGAIALVVLPVFGTVALVPRTVIEGLYGDRWLGAVPLLVPLALAVSFHAMMAVAGPVVLGKGQAGKELSVSAVVAVLFLAVLLLTSQMSLVTLAWGVFAVYVVRFLLMTSVVLRLVGGTWGEVLVAFRGGLLAFAATAPIVLGVDSILSLLGTEPFFRLLGDVFVGATAVVTLIVALPSSVLPKEALFALSLVSHKLPPFLWRLVVRAGAGQGWEASYRAEQ